jgi:hypothetical protein
MNLERDKEKVIYVKNHLKRTRPKGDKLGVSLVIDKKKKI